MGQSDNSDPVSVFSELIAALQSSDWERAANLCDPVSLDLMKQEFVRDYNPDRSGFAPAPTEDDYMRFDPDLPPAVANYYVERAQRSPSAAARMQQQFHGIGTYEELRAASPLAVCVAWLAGHSLQRQLERHVESGELPREALAAAEGNLRFQYDFTALGFVTQGDTLAHVVYHRNMESDEGSDGPHADRTLEERAVLAALWDQTPSIATLRRQPDGSWRVLASERFLGAGSDWSFVSTITAEAPQDSIRSDG